MSVTLMAAVWKMDLPATDKMVLLALADAANDSGVTWIAVKSRDCEKQDLRKKCSLSERAIQGAIKRLCDASFLSRIERPGKGVIYSVTPAGNAPRTTCAPQQMPPAANSADPRTSCGETISNHQSKSLSTAKRASKFVPDSWTPNEKHAAKALSLGLDLQEVTEGFRLHEFKDPKSDFDLAFHRWLRTASTYAPRKSHDRSSAKLDHLDGIRRAMEAACQSDEYAVRDRWEPGDGGRMRALPSAA